MGGQCSECPVVCGEGEGCSRTAGGHRRVHQVPKSVVKVGGGGGRKQQMYRGVHKEYKPLALRLQIAIYRMETPKKNLRVLLRE